jgi:hypothetical protein
MFGLDPNVRAATPIDMEVRRSLLFPQQEVAVPRRVGITPGIVNTEARLGCPPINTGGRTINSPCPGWLGCSLEDFKTVRGLFASEYNDLIILLDLWEVRVAAAKAASASSPTWYESIPLASYKVYEDAYQLLTDHPYNYGEGLFNKDGVFIKPTIIEFLTMLPKVHQAACDMREALAQLGAPVPSIPVPPEEPKGTVEQVFDGAKDLVGSAAGGVVYLAVGLGGAALLGAVAYYLVTSSKGKR